MKTCSTRSYRRLLLKACFFENSHCIDQIYQLERALARKPQQLQIDIVGVGEIAPDSTLLIRSILLKRSPQTHLITNARSSLQGGSVLVWLLGDTRLIREDAKLYFRRPASQNEDEDAETWKDEDTKTSSPMAEVDLDEVDYAQVLQYIDEFLPVKELAGHLIDLSVLKQYGLLDNEKVDQFLATAFGNSASHPESPPPEPEKRQEEHTPKVPQSDSTNKSN